LPPDFKLTPAAIQEIAGLDDKKRRRLRRAFTRRLHYRTLRLLALETFIVLGGTLTAPAPAAQRLLFFLLLQAVVLLYTLLIIGYLRRSPRRQPFSGW